MYGLIKNSNLKEIHIESKSLNQISLEKLLFYNYSVELLKSKYFFGSIENFLIVNKNIHYFIFFNFKLNFDIYFFFN
jgi:hypothetical protein